MYKIRLDDQGNDTFEKVYVQGNDVSEEMVTTYNISRREHEKRKKAIRQERTKR
jgi:hypothetical protein